MYMYAILCVLNLLCLLTLGSGVRNTPPLVNEPSVQGAGQHVSGEVWLRPCHQLVQIVGGMMGRWCSFSPPLVASLTPVLRINLSKIFQKSYIGEGGTVPPKDDNNYIPEFLIDPSCIDLLSNHIVHFFAFHCLIC